VLRQEDCSARCGEAGGRVEIHTDLLGIIDSASRRA
jgi:hypothetical protein